MRVLVYIAFLFSLLSAGHHVADRNLPVSQESYSVSRHEVRGISDHRLGNLEFTDIDSLSEESPQNDDNSDNPLVSLPVRTLQLHQWAFRLWELSVAQKPIELRQTLLPSSFVAVRIKHCVFRI